MTGSPAMPPILAALALAVGCGRVGFERDPVPDSVPDPDARPSACMVGAPSCTDSSCSRFTWTFDAGTLDGITPRAPTDLVLTVRDHAGNPSLAIDVIDLFEIQFTVPICLSGTIGLQTKTLSATVMFDGEIPSGPQYYLQTSMPEPMN